MNYIENNLSKQEVITKRVELSKIGLVIPSFFLLVSLIMPLFLILAIYLIVEFFTTEQAVTNKKVITKVGVISKKTTEIRLVKAENVSIKQNLLGLIFNYGKVIVTGTGGSQCVFRLVSNPVEVKNEIDDLLDK